MLDRWRLFLCLLSGDFLIRNALFLPLGNRLNISCTSHKLEKGKQAMNPKAIAITAAIAFATIVLVNKVDALKKIAGA